MMAMKTNLTGKLMTGKFLHGNFPVINLPVKEVLLPPNPAAFGCS